jgi:hypothetical protein
LTRRELLSASAAFLYAGHAKAVPANDSLILLTAQEAERIRQNLPSGPAKQLKSAAERELKSGPWSVTFHRPEGSKFDPHDYFSEGPYFWPDPNNPNGPYIRHDGKRNPERFDYNHHDVGAMGTAVLSLGAGAFLFSDNRYAEHAAKILSTWFLDPQTRMNPNLEHGQAVRGVNDGRGTGLIDTVSLIHCAQGIVLLEQAGKLDGKLASGLRQWYGDFLRWMTTSKKGQAEENSGNNHATWWTAQIAAYATFTRNAEVLDLAWKRYRTYLVPTEIQPDGKCPREEARTKSLSYSVFNADAFATLCRIAQSSGVDLWSYRAPNGVSYEKVVRYVEPFMLHPETWKGEQIAPFKPDSTIFLGLAGAGLHAKDLLDAHRSLPRSDGAWTVLIDLIVAG